MVEKSNNYSKIRILNMKTIEISSHKFLTDIQKIQNDFILWIVHMVNIGLNG